MVTLSIERYRATAYRIQCLSPKVWTSSSWARALASLLDTGSGDVRTMSAIDRFAASAELAAVRATTVSDGTCAVAYRICDGSAHRWVHDAMTFRPAADGRSAGHITGLLTRLPDTGSVDEARPHRHNVLALGEAATTLAHELNQPLTVVRMASENALIRLAECVPAEDTDYVSAKLRRIVTQVDRATEMIDQVRIFTRPPATEGAPFPVVCTVNGALDAVSEQMRAAGIHVELDAHGSDAHVCGVSSHLEQVLVNLLNNARDAIAERRERDPDTVARIRLRLDRTGAGTEVAIAVEDTGGGIADDVLSRIFDLFYTTKPSGQGTGVGLAISQRIVRDMGGTLTVANADAGAVFTITLPLHAATTSADFPSETGLCRGEETPMGAALMGGTA